MWEQPGLGSQAGEGVPIPCEGGQQAPCWRTHSTTQERKTHKSFYYWGEGVFGKTPLMHYYCTALQINSSDFFLGFFFTLRACNMTNPFPDMFGDGRLQLALP